MHACLHAAASPGCPALLHFPFQQVHGHPPPFTELYFTVPSWYLFTIGLKHGFSFKQQLQPLFAHQSQGTQLSEGTPYSETCSRDS